MNAGDYRGMRESELEKLRGVVGDCLSKHLYSSAVFFADRVAAATGDPTDVLMQAHALFFSRHFRRALHLLTASGSVDRDIRFRYLAAKCLEEMKEWHQCLMMLGDAKVDEHGNVHFKQDSNSLFADKDKEDHELNFMSAICFLRGKAHEALESHAQARLWYRAAVKTDPLCYEALERLVESYMLTYEEESSLLSSLQFGKDDGWLRSFYSCFIKKHDKGSAVEEKFRDLDSEESNGSSSDASSSHSLTNHPDLLVCKAEYYLQRREYQMSFEITAPLLERDPYHLKCTLVHAVSAMELGHSNDLFLMACNLVRDCPQKALSWFVVGCYYYCIKKYQEARRYFCKATSVDASFTPAWIASGNAYAALEESDQAMAAYRTSARLFPGCHLSLLYIGMEHMRTHNFKLAEQCLQQAKTICPSDPLIFNELGVVAYHMKEYQKAVQCFEKALSHVGSSLTEIWEPTLVNLGHAQRKLRMYSKAVINYERALSLSARSFSAFVGLAYTYHLQARYDAAITYYHKALRLQPDDYFCTEMLTLALEEDV